MESLDSCTKVHFLVMGRLLAQLQYLVLFLLRWDEDPKREKEPYFLLTDLDIDISYPYGAQWIEVEHRTNSKDRSGEESWSLECDVTDFIYCDFHLDKRQCS